MAVGRSTAKAWFEAALGFVLNTVGGRSRRLGSNHPIALGCVLNAVGRSGLGLVLGMNLGVKLGWGLGVGQGVELG